MDAVAFTAGEDADFLLLVGACEVERGAVATRVDLAFAEFQESLRRLRSLRRRFSRGRGCGSGRRSRA